MQLKWLRDGQTDRQTDGHSQLYIDNGPTTFIFYLTIIASKSGASELLKPF